jgi:hypothetical protein
MSKVKCPHCGHWQEAYPHVILCGSCYAEMKEVVDAHFKRGDVEPADARQQSEGPLWRKILFPNDRGSGFLRLIIKAARARAAEKGGRSSGAGVIFKKTLGTFATRFWTLCPLMYLSISFFMLIGLFLSLIGVSTFVPEEYPADSSMEVAFAAGIAVCLLVSLYTQAGFIFALSNAELSLSDALTRALRRFGSYVGLIVLMVASVVAGASMFIVPGVVAGILFSFAPFVLAGENEGSIAALSKSVRYVVGSFARVFLRLAPVGMVVIFMWFFFAYVGMPVLMAVRNEIAFIFIVSGLLSLPITFITVYVFTIYDDLRMAGRLVSSSKAAAQPFPEELTRGVAPVATRLPPFTDLLGSSWEVYKNRFIPLTLLNIASYLPHAIHIGILLVGYLGLKWFLEGFQATGEFGLLILLVLPKGILALLIAAVLIYLGLYALAQIFGLALYLLLELAYIYVVSDETIGAWQAIRKARNRLKGFFWVELYRNFIVSTGFSLFVPGVVFWVWYEFTPYVFALQREEGTPLSSLFRSRELVRGLWGRVFMELISLRALPLVFVIILMGFIFAGLPFYWILGGFLFVFTGHYLPGMFIIYGPHFWLLLYLFFFLLFGGFYLPFQKVVLYGLYKELRDLKVG